MLHGAPFIKPADVGKLSSFESGLRSSQNSKIADSHVFINKQDKKRVAEKDRKKLQK